MRQMTKPAPLILLTAWLTLLAAGCAVFGPPQPSVESQGVRLSWLGAPVSELDSVMGRAANCQARPDGRGECRWFKEKTVTGPPRTEFGPGGRIKTRPGEVSYNYCRAVAVVDSDNRIDSLEFTGDCPVSLLPPARNRR